MNRTRSLFTVTLALAGLSMGGCIWTPTTPKATPSTDKTRIEFELVTNAKLARIDTTPRPQGRRGFVRGDDQLLVLTRITSVNKEAGNPGSPRVDRYFERVWITVPMSTPQGAELVVEELEEKFLVGYDRNAYGRGYFIRPNKASGKIKLIERRQNSAVIQIDIRVAPHNFGNWQIRETLEVPYTDSGIHATLAQDSTIYHPDELVYPLTPYEDVPEDLAPPPDTAQPTTSTPKEQATPMPDENTDNAQGEEPGVPDKDKQTPEAKAPAATTVVQEIIGSWFGHTPPHPNKIYYELHFQFMPDGTCALATGRSGGSNSGYPPGMRYGTYTIENGFVIMNIKKFVFQNENVNHLPKKGLILALKIDWQGNKLVLIGDYHHPISDDGKFSRYLRIELGRRDFPDLRKFRPAPDLKGGYEYSPEPDYNDIVGIKVRHRK